MTVSLMSRLDLMIDILRRDSSKNDKSKGDSKDDTSLEYILNKLVEDVEDILKEISESSLDEFSPFLY
jgi:hypothetical protein